MEENLDKYDIEEANLFNDINNGGMTYSEVKERLNKIYDLVPITHLVNFFRLNELIKNRFEHEQEYKDDMSGRTYTINISK